jgi:hypothetical protein
MPEIFVSADGGKQKGAKTPSLELPQQSPSGSKLFASFNLYPQNIDFETKEKEEKIILMLRQHPVINLKWIFVSIVLFICPAILGKIGILSGLTVGYRLVITLTWYLVTFAYAIEGFFSWYFNVFFVTTRRVIDVDFFNLINKRVSDAEIEKIQDVSYSTSGATGTTFNFGNVLIQTASEIPELNFERVPNPEKVADILDDLREKVH